MTDFNQKTHDTDVGSHGGQSRQMMEVFENQEFGSIRLLQEAGKTFFCASDVAKALGYVNPYAAVKRHCRDPLTKREGVVQKVNQYGDAGEQVVEISFITEGDVYRLIVHSKLPSAERFEHWVFDEVLPSIRKHGVYMSDSILDQVIQHPEVIYTLAQKLVAEREQLEGMKSQNGERFSIKQMEKTRKGLEARLEKLRATDRKDDVITFEQLGVDRLFVDEAHAFKNLFLYTKMRNVAGLSTSEAQKSSDMFMKCQYMDELTGGRGIIFATGTPVSNSMTELYTMIEMGLFAAAVGAGSIMELMGRLCERVEDVLTI